MWGLFAGEARKQPPHIPFSTAISKDPDFSAETYVGLVTENFKIGKNPTIG